MKSYVVPGLTADQLKRLKAGGVQYFRWQHDGTLLADEEALRLALEILNARAIETPTELEGIVKISLDYRTSPIDATAAKQTLPPAELPAPPVRVRPDSWESSRALYIRACAARMQEIIKSAFEVFQAKRALLPEAEATFVKLARRSCFAQQSLSAAALEERFEREIDMIRETPKVARVRVTRGGNTILVYTDTLYATAPDSGERHEIGKFLIRIQPDASVDCIRFYNATRRVDAIRPEMNAPYVLADGSVTADEIKQIFLDQVARCEFAALTDLAIQFIETVNDDRPGSFITRWPGADHISNLIV